MNPDTVLYENHPDNVLMELITKGDTSAFDELYKRYSKRLLYYFYRMLRGDEATAQDFLQDIFLKIAEKPNLYRSNECFSTWIFTIAHNLCKNEYRRRSVRKIVRNDAEIDCCSSKIDNDELFVIKKLEQNQFNEMLLTELKSFDEIHKTTFLLRYQENFSIKEISAIVKCSEGTVKSRLFYTTKRLAEKLKEFNQ
jgi:RNA polymerase sigma-70 factor, ECF subfamily